MAKQLINRGTAANDGTGDNLRAGADKVNTNFTELYTALGDGTTLLAGNYVTDSASQVLANKTISGASNTITNIPSSALSSLPNTKLDNSSITIGDDTSTNFNVELGGSFEIVGGSGISTAITNNRIELSVASVPNSSLVNDSVTIGSTEVNLGTTLSTTANLNLTGTSSLSGTGTIDLTTAGSKIRFDFSGFGSLPSASTYVGMYAYDSVGNRPYYSSGSGWVRLLDENSSVSAHTDVNTTGVADGNVLTWSSAQGRFNVTAPASGSVALDDLTDVVNSSPTAGMSLVYNGTNWVQATTPVSATLK